MIQVQSDQRLEPHPPPLPVSSLNQLDGKAWRNFFCLTGGSILYCLSALSIIYGIARNLGPILARTDVLRDAYPCLAALNIYEIALLGVLVFIVVRKKVTDDAISLVVLVALFLVGSGLTLSTVANSGHRVSLLIGVSCFFLGVAKLHVLKRYVGLVVNLGSFAGLTVILAWNFGSGPLLARSAALGAVGRGDWIFSFMFLIAGGLIVFVAAQSSGNKSEGHAAKTSPFLYRPAAKLVFVSILLVAGAIHQYALGYVFEVRSDAGDYLPIVSVASLIAVQLSINIRSRADLLEAGIAIVPFAFCGYAVLSKSVLATPSLGAETIWHPPFILGLTGAAVFWVWHRARSPYLLGVCGAYLLGVTLTFGFSPGRPLDLNWQLSGALLISGLLLIGLFKRSITLCLLAVIFGTAGFAATSGFQRLIAAWNLTHPATVVGIAGVGTLAITLVFGRRMPPILVAMGSLGVMAFVFDILPAEVAASDLVALAAVLTLCAAIWMRVHYWLPIVLLLIPVAQRLWVIFSRLTGWGYVVISFVLLFAGAWLSALKGRRTFGHDPSTNNVAAEKGDDGQQNPACDVANRAAHDA